MEPETTTGLGPPLVSATSPVPSTDPLLSLSCTSTAATAANPVQWPAKVPLGAVLEPQAQMTAASAAGKRSRLIGGTQAI